MGASFLYSLILHALIFVLVFVQLPTWMSPPREKAEPVPIIIDLKKAGWQVVPAVKWSGNADLWCGRFGSGKQTIFTITNPTAQRVKTSVRIFERYLGTADYQPVAVTGPEITPEKRGDLTCFDLELQPGEILILRDRTWKKPPQTLYLSPEEQIADFFQLADAQNGTVTVVSSGDRNAGIVYDYIDRYYPYVQACLKKHGSPFTREPGMLDPAYNTLWRLPRASALTSGKQIVIGTPEQFPALANLLSDTEKEKYESAEAPFLKVFPERKIFWIGARNSAGFRQAAESYFSLLDQKLNKSIGKEYK